jgi:O-methyltransferase domain/Dimerisation domain
MESEPLTPDRIRQIGHAFRSSRALLSAVELGIFTVLADGPADIEVLSKRTGIHPRGARDFFDSLVALGMLKRDGASRYYNAPDADLYLDRRKATYVGGELEHFGTYVFPHWALLTKALETGEPQSGARVAGHYSALYADQAALETLVKGMTGGTLPVAKALSTEFDWEKHNTIVDIGSAEGCLPVQIAIAHPHIRGGGFDLPPVRPLFERYVSEHSLSDRLRFYEGDFLEDPLPKADVLVLGRILHNWDLATKKLLLRKAYAALPPGGVLVVYERLIDNARRTNAAALLASLNMLIMTAGGFDFTRGDCIRWLSEAGFHDLRTAPLTTEVSMVLGVK